LKKAIKALELLGLIAHGLAGRGGLFDQGGVLLGGLVHLQDRFVDLFDPRGLFPAGGGDLGDDVADFLDRGDDLLRVWPERSTSLPPSSTLATLSVIRALISLAASALRWASLRTSPATTAKPRPCSPARAASTAAFRPAGWSGRRSRRSPR
jgi:hypothetical protein